MTRKTTLTLASALALVFAAGVAQAQDRAPARGPGLDFAAFDTDGDGKITREELEARRLERLRAMDPDGDGFITRDEMKTRMGEAARARAEAMAERMFERMDADKDGRISAAEALAARGHDPRGGDPARMFDRLDRDGDGAIGKEEFDRAMRAGPQARKGERGDKGPRHHHRHGGERPQPRN